MKKSGKTKSETGRDNRDVQWYIKKEIRDVIYDPNNIGLDERINNIVRNSYNWKLLYTYEKTNKDKINKEWWEDSWILNNEQCFLLTLNKYNGISYDLFATGTGSFSLEYSNSNYDHILNIYNKIGDFTSIKELMEEYEFSLARRQDPTTLEKYICGPPNNK